MTKQDLTQAEQDLLDEINFKIDKMEKTQGNFVKNFLTAVAIGVTVFLLLITGSYAYTDRIRTECDANAKAISDNEVHHAILEREVGLIDGALRIRFPESAVFGQARDRIIIQRGGSTASTANK